MWVGCSESNRKPWRNTNAGHHNWKTARRFCVSWKDPASGKRRRYQLEARSRKDAEPEAVEVYRRETFRANPAGSRLDEIWKAYIEDLGDRPTATTMGYTGKAILPHFGGYLPQDIDKTMCLRYRQMREETGKSVGTV
ncbi:hypothetical protein [Celeribacter sp. ULVN23_4]